MSDWKFKEKCRYFNSFWQVWLIEYIKEHITENVSAFFYQQHEPHAHMDTLFLGISWTVNIQEMQCKFTWNDKVWLLQESAGSI